MKQRKNNVLGIVLGVSVVVLLGVIIAFAFKWTKSNETQVETDSNMEALTFAEPITDESNSQVSDTGASESPDSQEVATGDAALQDSEGQDVDSQSEENHSKDAQSGEDLSEANDSSDEASDEQTADQSQSDENQTGEGQLDDSQTGDSENSNDKTDDVQAVKNTSDGNPSEEGQVEGDQPGDAQAADSQSGNDTAAGEQTENTQSDAQSAGQTDEQGQGAEGDAADQNTAPAGVSGGHLVMIDPGHQVRGNSNMEPNGPGSSSMKAKVTGGTSGKSSGLTEYQLNLAVGLKLKDELIRRGYTVMMTRESNDVDISNAERAQMANNAGAEAFIRIHANGSDDTSVSGAMTICQTPSNPYNSGSYAASRKLSDCVLNAFSAATGCKKQYVWETDTMTGINWATVPSTIIEMGYMTNPAEDLNMASEDYQNKMAQGIANGIDDFFR